MLPCWLSPALGREAHRFLLRTWPAGRAWRWLTRAQALLRAPHLLLPMSQILSKFVMFLIYLNYNI